VFVNEKGTSSTFLSLLTKQDVLDALGQQPYANYEVHRMVGGGFLDSLRSSLGWITSKLPMVKQALGSIPHPYAQTGAKVLRRHRLRQGEGQDRGPGSVKKHASQIYKMYSIDIYIYQQCLTQDAYSAKRCAESE
jgi:hypothetical protein